MTYLVRESVDRVVTVEQVFCFPQLHVETQWWINGESQGMATIGFSGFLLTKDRRTCLEVRATTGCQCSPAPTWSTTPRTTTDTPPASSASRS